MFGRELPVTTVDEALRLVRALGKHRYVASRGIYVHALVAALGDESDLSRWAVGVLGDSDVDPASRDERLMHPATEEELAHLLEGFWGVDPSRREKLRAALDNLELPVSEGAPFDESLEEDMHPVLVDAGWELLPLRELDATRHRGAIEAFGEPILFESARFEEENAIPPPNSLQELPALGAVELLRGAEGGMLKEAFVLWCEGNETYLDYVTRGVLRAAKLA
jgi:hypothetical protein